jgi:hypothetical protein
MSDPLSEEISQEELQRRIEKVKEVCRSIAVTSRGLLVSLSVAIQRDLNTPGRSVSRSTEVKEALIHALLTNFAFMDLPILAEVQKFLIHYALYDTTCTPTNFDDVLSRLMQFPGVNDEEWPKILDIVLNATVNTKDNATSRHKYSEFWRRTTDRYTVQFITREALSKGDRAEAALFALCNMSCEADTVAIRAPDFYELLNDEDLRPTTLVYLACSLESHFDETLAQKIYTSAVDAISSNDKLWRAVGLLVFESVAKNPEVTTEQYNRMALVASNILQDVILEKDTEFLTNYYNLYNSIPLTHTNTNAQNAIVVQYITFLECIVNETEILTVESRNKLMDTFEKLFELLQTEYATIHKIDDIAAELPMRSFFAEFIPFVSMTGATYADRLSPFVEYSLDVVDNYISLQIDESEFDYDISKCIVVNYFAFLWTVATETPREVSTRLMFEGEIGVRFKGAIQVCLTVQDNQLSLINTVYNGITKLAEQQRLDLLFPKDTKESEITTFVFNQLMPKLIHVLELCIFTDDDWHHNTNSLYHHAISNTLICVGDTFTFYIAPHTELVTKFEQNYLTIILNLITSQETEDIAVLTRYAFLTLKLGQYYPDPVLPILRDGFGWLSGGLLVEETIMEREIEDGVSGLLFLMEKSLEQGFKDVRPFVFYYDRYVELVPSLAIELRRVLLKCLIALE